jgi:XTP/dITP diphosphohydrolase
MNILVATNNRDKLEEIRAILACEKALRVLSLADAGICAEIEETGETFEENALLKAMAAWRILKSRSEGGGAVCARSDGNGAGAGIPAAGAPAALALAAAVVVADDSGLCVDALGGAPGVRSARYAGEGATSAQRNEKLLRSLDGVEADKRSARFVCAAAAVFPDGGHAVVTGECRGFIAQEPTGENGFGYDPVFFYPELRRTVAQMTRAAKREISHRGRAFHRLAPLLSEYAKGLSAW